MCCVKVTLHLVEAKQLSLKSEEEIKVRNRRQELEQEEIKGRKKKQKKKEERVRKSNEKQLSASLQPVGRP